MKTLDRMDCPVGKKVQEMASENLGRPTRPKDDLIERLLELAGGLEAPVSFVVANGKKETQQTVREAATALDAAQLENAELALELSKVKHGEGWRAFEDAKAELGRIIKDDYPNRSMFPRLVRVETWWNDMKARAEKAEAERDEARGRLRRIGAACEGWENDTFDARETIALIQGQLERAAIANDQEG